MNTERIARGWALIAEGAMELSLAYSAIEPAVARTAVPESVPAAGAAGVVPPAPAAPYEPSPFDSDAPLPDKQAAHVAAVLGQCPDHQIAWSVKPAGVGAKGSYSAFWRCNQRVGEGWCKKKPVKAWSDQHPIQEVAA